MKKLKKQKINQLINYQIYFKKIKINVKKIIYENSLLFSFNGITIIENNIDHNPLIFDNNLTDIINNPISTIIQKYNNSFLFNYKLTFDILVKFHNNIINKKIKKNIIFKGLTIIQYKKIFKNILISKQQIINQKIKNKKNTYQYFYLLFGHLFEIKNKKLIKNNSIKKYIPITFNKKKIKVKIVCENQLKSKKIIIQRQKQKYNISRNNYLLYIINLYKMN